MKNRLYLILGLLVVAALGWATWQALRPLPREPLYEGVVVRLPTEGGRPPLGGVWRESVCESHPLSFWLTNSIMMGSPVPEKLYGDPNAVPFLVRALKRDSWFGAAFYRKSLWPKLPAPIQRHLPPPLAENFPAREGAVIQLGDRHEKQAIPLFIHVLEKDDNPCIRSDGAHYLGGLVGGDNKAAVAALTAALRDSDAGVRFQAALSLSGLGIWDKAAIQVLTQQLNSRNTADCWVATNALRKIDPAAAKAGVKMPSR
jgi:hypothetical protein